MRKVALPVLLVALVFASVGVRSAAAGNDLVLVYMAIDLESKDTVVGPFFVPMAELPLHQGHQSYGVASDADGKELKVICRAFRATESGFKVHGRIEKAGSDKPVSRVEDLKAVPFCCSTFTVPDGESGRFLFVFSICAPRRNG